MTAAAPGAGLVARAHPLMVLGGLVPAPVTEPGITVRLVSADEPELDRIWAVPAVAFGHPGTAVGLAGAIERDKIAADHDEGTMDMLRERLRSGQSVLAVAFGPDGPLAAGSCQPLGGVAEITGVGVLPSSRRMGLGGAVDRRPGPRGAAARGADRLPVRLGRRRGAHLRPAGLPAHRHRHDRRARGLARSQA